ncbi:F-box containing protein [Brazilian marseillevirus]|uniref:F-box containing protein n=1 Tax=Brazilian marseillevirus TaxID=1813599 RepID=UPI00078380A8|nr:F-box containing protein [Brazilian marseillevirus]AMQ10522.1 F-box containing protein [Brazilian marseillevirus]
MDLPVEITLSILEFVDDINDILSFSLTCRENKEVTDFHFRVLTRRVFGTPKEMRGNKYLATSYYFVDPFGREQGEAKLFRQNSYFTVNFMDGKKHGNYLQVSNTGIVICRGQYENGKRQGLWYSFDVQSTDELRELWKDGGKKVMHHKGKSEYIVKYEKFRGEAVAAYRFLRVKAKKLGNCPTSSVYTLNAGHGRIKYSHCCKMHQGEMPDSLF